MVSGFDETTERVRLVLPTPHRLPVDAQSERGIGVAHFIHDDPESSPSA